MPDYGGNALSFFEKYTKYKQVYEIAYCDSFYIFAEKRNNGKLKTKKDNTQISTERYSC